MTRMGCTAHRGGVTSAISIELMPRAQTSTCGQVQHKREGMGSLCSELQSHMSHLQTAPLHDTEDVHTSACCLTPVLKAPAYDVCAAAFIG